MSPAFAGICEGQERKAEVEWEHLQYYGYHRAILAKAKSQGKTKRIQEDGKTRCHGELRGEPTEKTK